MLTDSFRNRLTYCPLIASLIMSLVGQSAIAQTYNHEQIRLPAFYTPTPVKLSQTTTELDEKKAFDLVWKLPIVQRKAREIQRLSKGTIRVSAVLESSPTPEEPYYTIRIVENHVKHIDTIYWFRVLSPSSDIQVLDLVENKYIPLKDWKPN
nr:hypothetical protein [Gloeotrichia echinulata DEX184]